MIRSFSHIYHRVRDLDETIDFYTKKLGFKLLRKYQMNGRVSAYIELGSVLLELSEVSDPSDLPGPEGERRLGLTVTDIDAVFAQLRETGVEIAQDPRDASTFWGRQGAIKDPSGMGRAPRRRWRLAQRPLYRLTVVPGIQVGLVSKPVKSTPMLGDCCHFLQ